MDTLKHNDIYTNANNAYIFFYLRTKQVTRNILQNKLNYSASKMLLPNTIYEFQAFTKEYNNNNKINLIHSHKKTKHIQEKSKIKE